MEGSRYEAEVGSTYLIDLTQSEDVLLAAMQPKTRQKIRKALRGGLRVDDTTDPQFADEFHANLTETFARQGIGPTYGVERVRQLIESLRGTPALLLLRVRSPEGKVLAAGISVGGRGVAVSWGLAMDRSDDELNPAQLLWWEPSGIGANAACRPSTWGVAESTRRSTARWSPTQRTSTGLARPFCRSAGMPCAGSLMRAKSSPARESEVSTGSVTSLPASMARATCHPVRRTPGVGTTWLSARPR